MNDAWVQVDGMAEVLDLPDALGIEYESRWSDIADANLRHARSQGATGRGGVIRGDATDILSLVPAALIGQVALVVTSPPYGPTVHGLVRTGDELDIRDNRYNDGVDRGNLAYRDLAGLADGFARLLDAAAPRRDRRGHRPALAQEGRARRPALRRHRRAGVRAGLIPTERCVALLAAVRDGHLVARPSFFQLQSVRKARAGGTPMHLIAHEDVLIFSEPAAPITPSIQDDAGSLG